MSQEHRRNPRTVKPILAKFRTPKGEWAAAPLRDFSRVGARFLTERTFPVGTRLEMRLAVPMVKSPVALHAIVVRSMVKASGIYHEHAVAFEAVDQPTSRLLAEAVNFFLKKERRTA